MIAVVMRDRHEVDPLDAPLPEQLDDMVGRFGVDSVALAKWFTHRFNDMGEGQWHAVVLDAATGQIIQDRPRRVVQGTADVDDDGAAELFLIGTDGELVPSCGQIELVSVRGATPAVRWSHDEAAWCVANVACLGPSWATTASQGKQHLLLRGEGRPAFVVKTWEAGSARRVALAAMGGRDDGRVETLWKVGGVLETGELVPVEETGSEGAASALRKCPV
jgi:hypothetical protein